MFLKAFFIKIINMLYSPVLRNSIAQSSPEPSLLGSSAGDLGSSSRVCPYSKPLAMEADVWACS